VKRLVIDLKEDHHGDTAGHVGFPSDSLFVLEALAVVVEQLAKAAELPPAEVAADLYRLVAGKVTPLKGVH
jgi:hypothetical protein